MASYAIGTEALLEITGIPVLGHSQLEAVERPGIEGTGFWDTGNRGKPFALHTVCDYASIGDALDAYSRYALLAAEGPQDLTFADVAYNRYGFLFQVLAVRAITVCALAWATGGLNPPSLGWCEAEWQMCAVPILTY
jgi:hypothetical protein